MLQLEGELAWPNWPLYVEYMVLHCSQKNRGKLLGLTGYPMHVLGYSQGGCGSLRRVKHVHLYVQKT
jgi:hypothetical protein